ncbi:MAG: hypothetical protein QM817_40985 [Archangium sp.]
MRISVALAALLPSVALALPDPFFVENFEAPTARLDAGGVWTEVYDVAANRTIGSVFAHRGMGGLNLSRQIAQPTNGTDTQLEWVSNESSLGESWLRWWMRTRVTAPAPQLLVGFGDTGVPNHIGLSHDPGGLYVVGFDGLSDFFAPRASDLPDAGWHLYELGIDGMGRRDAGVQLVVDGTTVLSYRTRLDFPDAGVRQINIGLTYAEPRSMLGSIDYDDVRGSVQRPAGSVRVTGLNGPWYVNTCVRLRVDFATSNLQFPRSLFDANALSLAISPPATFFVDDMCSALVGLPFIVPAGTNVVDLWFSPPSPGNYVVTIGADDLLSGTAAISVQPMPIDAGQTDAGRPDAGIADAGAADAGDTDAGIADAGDADAGEVDAGANVDAGTPGDAGSSTDAGAMISDAGSDDPRELTVGCGCDASSGAWSFALLLLASRRRQR